MRVFDDVTWKMNGDPKEARLNCARFQLPTSFVRQPGMGKRDGQRGPKDEERVEETVQVVHQSRDLFDAVLNGRLEIKKLRINASWDWLASPFFSFCFLSFVPPTFSSIFFLFFVPSISLGTIVSTSSFNSRPQSELCFRAIAYRWRALPGLASLREVYPSFP